MNITVVKVWFDEYQNLLSELGIGDKPDRFWNCDETGVQDQFDQGRAIGEVGQPCYRITAGEKGKTTTILASFSPLTPSFLHDSVPYPRLPDGYICLIAV